MAKRASRYVGARRVSKKIDCDKLNLRLTNHGPNRFSASEIALSLFAGRSVLRGLVSRRFCAHSAPRSRRRIKYRPL